MFVSRAGAFYASSGWPFPRPVRCHEVYPPPADRSGDVAFGDDGFVDDRASGMELLLDACARIGESPTWVAAEQAVYWIDVRAPALHKLVLPTRETRVWHLPAEIGAFALARGLADAVVALRTGIFRLALET